MRIEETLLAGVLLLEPARFGDARGFFSESWNQRRMQEHGIDLDFVQDMDLSRNCSAPLTWYFATKEKHHGTETNPGISRGGRAGRVD